MVKSVCTSIARLWLEHTQRIDWSPKHDRFTCTMYVQCPHAHSINYIWFYWRIDGFLSCKYPLNAFSLVCTQYARNDIKCRCGIYFLSISLFEHFIIIVHVMHIISLHLHLQRTHMFRAYFFSSSIFHFTFFFFHRDRSVAMCVAKWMEMAPKMH